MLTRENIRRLVQQYGNAIIDHPNMAIERSCVQHGTVSTFDHSIRVTCDAVFYADRLRLWDRIDLPSLVHAGLLHDYFLYDWHDWDRGSHRLHGFTHPSVSLHNARRDFDLNDVECDSILNHMFPLTPVRPHYIEGVLITMSDKISATDETVSPRLRLLLSHTHQILSVNFADLLDADGRQPRSQSATRTRTRKRTGDGAHPGPLC